MLFLKLPACDYDSIKLIKRDRTSGVIDAKVYTEYVKNVASNKYSGMIGRMEETSSITPNNHAPQSTPRSSQQSEGTLE